MNNNSPFKLTNTDEYLQWRETKLKMVNTSDTKRILNLKRTPPTFYEVSTKPHSSSSHRFASTLSRQRLGLPASLKKLNNKSNRKQIHTYPIDTILSECSKDNYCLYSIEDYKKYDRDQTKQLISSLAHDCNLKRLDNNLCADKDSLTSICCTSRQGQHEYIPYTNKKLNWHTDGYYNLPNNTIYSMLLHCFDAAEHGGESAFIDHEIAYLLMRDENPAWIEALSQNNVMTIPENILNGKVIRAEQTGPVFSITPQGRLHMRYSARQKNIIWLQDKDTLEAIKYLQSLLNSDSEYIIRHTLKAGEGIISRNILHCRTAFDDKEQSDVMSTKHRLLFRGRFYDELPLSIS